METKILFGVVIILCSCFLNPVIGHASQLLPCGRNTWPVHNCGWDKIWGAGWWQPDHTGPSCGVCGDEAYNHYNSRCIFCSDEQLNHTGLNCCIYNGYHHDNNTHTIKNLSEPLDHQYLGKYWPPTACDAFREGQVIATRLAFWNSHLGTVEWRLCEDTTLEVNNQSCFNSYLLEVISADDPFYAPAPAPPGGVSTSLIVSTDYDLHRGSQQNETYVNVALRLPANLTCSRCVLQFTYLGRAGNMFRTCSDIAIYGAPAHSGALLRNNAFNTCLAVDPTSAKYTNMLAPCNKSDPNQQIATLQTSIANLNNGTLTFASNGNCLDDAGQSVKIGSAVINYPCASNLDPVINQAWTTKSIDGTSVQFVNQKSGLCVAANLTNVFQDTCNNQHSNQIWNVELF